jgi:hypothetical protein
MEFSFRYNAAVALVSITCAAWMLFVSGYGISLVNNTCNVDFGKSMMFALISDSLTFALALMWSFVLLLYSLPSTPLMHVSAITTYKKIMAVPTIILGAYSCWCFLYTYSLVTESSRDKCDPTLFKFTLLHTIFYPINVLASLLSMAIIE